MRIYQLSSGAKKADELSATFVFEEEEYTLGKSLGCIIDRYPDVKCCLVTVQNTETPTQLLIQIQTYKGRPVDMLKKGLEDLAEVCDHILDEFNKELQNSEMRE